MLGAHHAIGLLVLVVAAVVVVWGGGVYFRRANPRRTFDHALALVQTLLIAQVALGLVLVTDDRRAPDQLHYAYGTLALGAALSPWLYAPEEPRRRLAWFVGATLLAGALAARAYMTAG